jgi:hypothetical protein
MKRNRRVMWYLAIMLVVANGLVVAQENKKEGQLRTVRGLVTDKADKPIQNAVVFLKNARTNVVISHFTGADGNYRFSGLDSNADYEIFAEYGGQKSNSRTVSSLESRKDITLNLKVEKKKD